jgi:hypothetical protein
MDKGYLTIMAMACISLQCYAGSGQGTAVNDITVDSLQYTVVDSTLTATLYRYNKKGDTAIIPATVDYNGKTYQVVSISNGSNSVFYNTHNNIRKVNLPDGIKDIGHYAFYNCQNLEEIEIPESVKSMGNYCLGYTNLKHLVMKPVKSPTLGENPFYGTNQLRIINIPEGSLNSYKKVEGWKNYITVEVSSSLVLLPETPMVARKENQRVGYFTTSRLQYGDHQQEVTRNNYITRWRLEPKDEQAYLRGELVEPKKPIVFYIDPAVPEFLRPYIKRGMTDWNAAFEKAGFKNAVQVFDLTDSIAAEGDDMKYSVLTYDASEKANAMGPSVIDPRTGEILEADIIWWHNVKSLLREWIMVQTGAYNKEARQYELPEALIGDAARFVACHEVGHSLGLRHNMIASNAYPTDSLRSKSFTDHVCGTAASIMDYARFNYVAQPGDGIQQISPQIGPYDLMAIEWGYRWFPDEKKAASAQQDFLKKHSGKEFRYSETQSQRTAIDPRSLSEDLGDDAMKSAAYGIANLKRVMPNIIDWTRTGEPGQTYDEASKLYQGVIFQWSLYLYHVLANVGGMYIDNTTIDDGKPTFTFVEKDKQRRAVQFLIDEVFTCPKWLFRSELNKYTFINKNTPLGVQEQSPDYALQNQQSYMLWDMLDNSRIMRMFANEQNNGRNAFTAVEMMDMLHKHFFGKTLAGKSLSVDDRLLQKNFVDALITAAAQQEGVKINKKIFDSPAIIDSPDFNMPCHSLSSAPRTIDMGGTQTARVSDAISVKRGELVRILNLLKGKRRSGDTATQFHYEDVIMRIQTALGQEIR